MSTGNNNHGLAVGPNDVGNQPQPYKVKHNEHDQEFYIELNDGHDKEQPSLRALLQYSWEQPGVADLWHTEVPPEFRGKGIAKVLAKAAFEYMVQENVKMRLSCTYLQKFYRENPLPQYSRNILSL